MTRSTGISQTVTVTIPEVFLNGRRSSQACPGIHLAAHLSGPGSTSGFGVGLVGCTLRRTRRESKWDCRGVRLSGLSLGPAVSVKALGRRLRAESPRKPLCRVTDGTSRNPGKAPPPQPLNRHAILSSRRRPPPKSCQPKARARMATEARRGRSAVFASTALGLLGFRNWGLGFRVVLFRRGRGISSGSSAGVADVWGFCSASAFRWNV